MEESRYWKERAQLRAGPQLMEVLLLVSLCNHTVLRPGPLCIREEPPWGRVTGPAAEPWAPGPPTLQKNQSYAPRCFVSKHVKFSPEVCKTFSMLFYIERMEVSIITTGHPLFLKILLLTFGNFPSFFPHLELCFPSTPLTEFDPLIHFYTRAFYSWPRYTSLS